jgi:hypothetical protein
MPSLKNGAVCVFHVYNVHSDVDLKTGNIDFDGDVYITGDIKEGMKVRAGNNLSVLGTVTGAELSAGGNISVTGNVISSTLKAGDKQLNTIQAIDYLKTFREFLSQFILAFNECIHDKRFSEYRNLSDLSVLILNWKFLWIRAKENEANKFFKENRLLDDIKLMWDDVKKYYLIIESGLLKDIAQITLLYQKLCDFLDSYEAILAPADVEIKYCQNSIIFATNNVEVTGKGCYNTSITAENTVKFTGVPGIFRGGQIFGKKAIFAREVGSPVGVASLLKTLKDGTIEADIAYPNTMLNFENHMYKIEDGAKTLKAYISKPEFIIEKFNL